MADQIDLANDLIDNELSRALNKIRQSTGEPKGSKHCVECGDTIPAARQQLGFKFCVPCAEEAERRSSLFSD